MEKQFSKFWTFTFLGTLTMFTTEIFAGSSLIWYIDLFAILVTFPLYLAHFLFYYNLAYRTGRTSIVHMYYWGTLFALYEAPITKVLWIGYKNTVPILGKIGGIAIFEFITLVFFYHPIFAFILPLSVFQLLFSNNGQVISPYWQKFEKLPTTIQIFMLIFFLSFASFSMISSEYRISIQFAATAGTLLILAWIYKSKRAEISETILILSDKGMKKLIAYLIFLYMLSFLRIRPEGIPKEPLAYVILLLFIFLILYLIFRYPKEQIDDRRRLQVINLRPLAVWSFFFVGIGILFGASPPLTEFVFLIIIFLMPILGILIFGYSLFKVARSPHWKSAHKNAQDEHNP